MLDLIIKNGSCYINKDLKNQDIPILYRSNHKVKGSINRKFFKNTNFSMLFNYKSSQKYEDFLSDVHSVVDNIFRFPIKKIPETILFDLQLSKNYTNYKITGIIMDEVDGMSSGDRGGVAELIHLISPSKGKGRRKKDYQDLIIIKNPLRLNF